MSLCIIPKNLTSIVEMRMYVVQNDVFCGTAMCGNVWWSAFLWQHSTEHHTHTLTHHNTHYTTTNQSTFCILRLWFISYVKVCFVIYGDVSVPTRNQYICGDFVIPSRSDNFLSRMCCTNWWLLRVCSDEMWVETLRVMIWKYGYFVSFYVLCNVKFRPLPTGCIWHTYYE
jgi:hypothetical protein